MRILCKQTTAEGFDLKEVDTISSNDFDYTFGGAGLELNKEYLVMGVYLDHRTHVLYYLIDTGGRPDWFPHLLFDVTDNAIPEKWFSRIYTSDRSEIFLVLGFDELCNQDGFFDLLMDRDETTMRTYFRRKIELEKKYDL